MVIPKLPKMKHHREVHDLQYGFGCACTSVVSGGVNVFCQVLCLTTLPSGTLFAFFSLSLLSCTCATSDVQRDAVLRIATARCA